MNFAERPPSTHWAAILFKGETLAEVWFKREGEPSGLTFRIPGRSFQIPGIAGRLTPENLLRSVGVPAEAFESCRLGDGPLGGTDTPPPELRGPLPPPAPDVPFREVHVRLKAPPAAAAEGGDAEAAAEKRQAVENRWRATLSLEASIDTLRLDMGAAVAEIESGTRRTLPVEIKTYALNADVDRWNKAKSRAHYTLPKAKDFIHRATWVMGSPDRKRVGELLKDEETRSAIPPAEMGKLQEELESLFKERQVLSAQGVVVYQDCKGLSAEMEAALRTLETNAAVNRNRKRRDAQPKGKFFKDVRRWSGAEG